MKISYSNIQRFGFATLLGLMLLVVGISVTTVSRQSKRVRSNLADMLRKSGELTKFKDELSKLSSDYAFELLYGDGDQKEMLLSLDRAKENLAVVRGLATTEDEKRSCNKLAESERRLRTLALAYWSNRTLDPSSDNLSQTLKDISLLIPPAIAEANRQHEIIHEAIGEERANIGDSLNAAVVFVVVSSVCVIGVGIIISASLTRALSKPIRMITKAAGEISRGNFDHRIEKMPLDDVGRLALGVNRMAKHLAGKTDALEEAKQAAELATRVKGEFLANMSHEIRTPMTAILGFTDVLAEELDQGDLSKQGVEAIQTIRRNGTFLLQIINDILDLSKIEAGKMDVELIPSSPCGLIADIASSVRRKASEKGLAFSIHYDTPMPRMITVDPTRLCQILTNLTGNAVKFTEKGQVSITVRMKRQASPLLEIDIEDTGIGLDEQQLQQLFQPFAQADASTTRRFGGTGLGLTISRYFARRMGGDIVIARTAVGVGTCFRVSIAVGDLDGVEMIESPKDEMSVSNKGISVDKVEGDALAGLRILLAEDGPDNQRLIGHVLRKAGADVNVVVNGQEAVDAVQCSTGGCQPFDVILMDMQMPVLDGYQASRRLRDAQVAIPIIALTANAMSSDRQRCLNAGCDEYVTKPINRRKLISTILSEVAKSALHS